MVGQHEVLYRRLSSAIRERFLDSGNITYCSLKMEIVMSAHDLNIESIIRSGNFEQDAFEKEARFLVLLHISSFILFLPDFLAYTLLQNTLYACHVSLSVRFSCSFV